MIKYGIINIYELFEQKMEQNEQQKKNEKVDYYRWIGFGVEFCAVIGFFCYAGFRLDEYFHTTPWLMLSLFFISFLGMMYITYKDLQKKSDKNEDKK